MRKQVLLFSFVLFLLVQHASAQYWKLTGNSDATSASKLGTLNSQALRFYTENKQRMQVDAEGRVIIGGNSSSSSALFEVVSTTKGVLIPRMTGAQRTAILSPAQGLLVYQSDGASGFYYYDGGWKPVTPAPLNTSGFANTMLSNLVPTAVNQDLVADGDNTRSLGSSSKGWKDIYMNGSVYLGGQRFLSGPGDNTFTGKSAGLSNSGTGNVANGYQALFSNTSGFNNTAAGYQSLYSNTTGDGNSAHGYQSLYSNTTGTGNSAHGYQALYSNTSGFNNTAQGYQSLFSNTTGAGNSANGLQSLYGNTSGFNNTAQGYQSLYNNTAGNSNSAHGYQSLYSNTSGSANTAQGSLALNSNTTGAYNTAVGNQSLYNNTSGINNTAQGGQSLLSNTTGNYNTAHGSSALYSNTTGNNNTAHGSSALYSNTTGFANTAQGYAALNSNTEGDGNAAQGFLSLVSNTTGILNAAHGAQSLYSNTTGSGNTGLGFDALNSNTTGTGSTAVGSGSLIHNTSSYNTGIGYNSGWSCSTCTAATFLGTNSNTVDGLDNVTAVGYGAQTTASNQVMLGNIAVTSVMAAGSYTIYSDGRFKRDLKEEVPGLEFINKLRPVTYHYKIHELNSHIKQESKALPKAGGMEAMKGMKGMEGMKEIEAPKEDERVAAAAKAKEEESIRAKEAIKYSGFVAQEVEEAAKKVNYDFSGVHKPTGSKDVYGLSYAEFVVPLVKAVQELSKKADKVDELEKENKELKERLDKLETMITGNNINNSISLSLSSAYLEVPAPNPSSGSTLLRYHVPTTVGSAKLVITDMKGSVLKTVNLSGRGNSQLTLSSTTLAAGSYTCTLYVDNVQADTKQMVIAR